MYLIKLFLFFIIMSIIGWLMEIFVCSLEQKKIVNRGFLIGPYCPIYGVGGLILLTLNTFRNNMVIVFVLSIILCSILEYITSYLMEKLFKVRWWDYSHEPFNINGRICLKNAIAFGVLGTLVVCYIEPFFFNVFLNSDDNVLIIISSIIIMILLVDIFISFNIMINIKKIIIDLDNPKISLKDATNDIKAIMNKILLEKNWLYRRIVKAYNKFDYYYLGVKEKLSKYKEDYGFKMLKRIKAKKLIIFMISGLLIGIIIGLLTNKFNNSFVQCLGLGVIINLIYEKVRKK